MWQTKIQAVHNNYEYKHEQTKQKTKAVWEYFVAFVPYTCVIPNGVIVVASELIMLEREKSLEARQKKRRNENHICGHKIDEYLQNSFDVSANV